MLTDPDGKFAQFIPMIVVGGYRVYKVYNTYKKVKGLKKAVKGPGTYVINYSNGYKYIGKGNLNRANQSAKRYTSKDSKVTAISWKTTKGHKNDFISEYKLMKKNGYYTNASKNIKNPQAKMYNKISSPGRKYHFKRYGKY